jgi:signal peptidase I
MASWLIVKGDSMAPYFKEGDKLYYDSSSLANLGSCIVFKKGDELIVHRFLGENSFKGDNVKRFDQELYQGTDTPLILEGVITHRLVQNELKSLKTGLLTRLLSLCSQYNHANIRLFHRLYATMVLLLGKTLRTLEEKA